MSKAVRFASIYNPNSIVSFTLPFDIEQMRKHSEYVEVKEEEKKEQKETPQVESKPEAVADDDTPVKRGRGRPRKVTADA